MKKYVTHLKDLAPYTPPGHSQTTNYRLLGPGPNGSERVEVVLGIIQFGGQADSHAHSANEQGFFILEGQALVEIGDEQETVGPNDFIFLPMGTPHKVVPLEGSALKILIFYAPPIFGGNIPEPKGRGGLIHGKSTAGRSQTKRRREC